MLYIKGMQGLGDNIYQRAFVRAYKEPIYLETPWPELYEDLPNVHLVRSDTKLRTQKKNVDTTSFTKWHDARSARVGATVKTVSYAGRGILNGMTTAFGHQPAEMNLPDWIIDVPKWIKDLGRFVIVRPATLRNEWFNSARNPRPEYIYAASRMLKERGWKIVSVADIVPGVEWIDGPEPIADLQLHKGELAVKDLLRLVAASDRVVAPIGWIVPASLALKKTACIVLGGNGGFNSPNMITLTQDHRITWIQPDRFCRCCDNRHNCDKEISNYEHKFSDWLYK